MAQKENIFVALTSEYDGKAFARAGKDMGMLDKSIHKLGKAFLGVFAAQKIAAFGKASVNAFAADEKAAKALQIQLKNLGYGYADKSVEDYIAKLQKMYGVLDDQLRPAFQTLITASGNLTASQRALNTALNVSAATGKSVEEISAALAKGFTGQTTALSRLGAGLDKTTLASGDMNKILDQLDQKFSGQAAARLTTYAGKMDQLTVASANAKEIIGKGLVDALSALGKDNSIQTVTSNMQNLAKEIAAVAVALGNVGSVLGKLNPQVGGRGLLAQIFFPGGSPSEVNAKLLGKGNVNTARAGRSFQGGQTSNDYYVSAQKDLALTKEKNRVAAQLLAKDKAKLALTDLANKFDIERINLQTALAAATDEETKLRIKAKLALLDQDSSLAALYNKQLDAAAASTKFAEAASQAADKLFNAFENASNYGAFRESPYVPGAAVASAGSGGGVTVNNYYNAPVFDSQQQINKMVNEANLQNNVTLGITAPAGFAGFL
jgi:hypothetical protein